MLDCSDGGVLSSLEGLMSHIMLPALRSPQVHLIILSVQDLIRHQEQNNNDEETTGKYSC